MGSLDQVVSDRALIFQPNQAHNLKLMGGRAFRAPSNYEYFYTDGGFSTLASDCCGNRLKPETFYQAELEYSFRFAEQWSLLLSAHGLFAQDFIGTLPVPEDQDPDMAGLVYFANIDEDQLIVGGDVEVRREYRGGWMFSGYVGYLEARFLDAPSAEGTTSSRRVTNSPRMYGSARGIIPIVERRVSLATRLTLEAPRRVSLTGDDETDWAVIGDIVLTGRVEAFGLRYAFGVYNVFDWRVDLPVDPFATPTLPQQGRSFLASVTLDI